MAVVEIKAPSSLRVKVELPMVEGRSRTRTKTFNSLKHDAPLQDAFDVGNALMALQQHSVFEIVKQDNTILGA